MEFQPNQLTADLRLILKNAEREAGARHAIFLDVEHLMLGLLKHHAGTAYELLKYSGADTNVLYEQIAATVGIERGEPIEIKSYTRAAQQTLARAQRIANSMGHYVIDSGHLLLSLMEEPEGPVHDILGAAALDAERMRGFLRDADPKPTAVPAAPDNSGPIGRPIRGGKAGSKRGSGRGARSNNDPEVVLVPFRPKRQKSGGSSTPSRWGNWPWIAGALALLLVYLIFVLPTSSLFTFAIVLIGWVFSVTLHEFSHALVAYMGGDYTVKDKGYLSFNPLKYTHPMLSIGMPLIFLALGGIGLPGGAVYIERHRLRSKWWGSAVSAAGPASNLVLAILLALPFATGLVDTRTVEFNIIRDAIGVESLSASSIFWSAMAFLAMLQVTAVIFNLLPIPPLDGFGILEPFLDAQTQMQLRQIGMYGLFLIFLLLWFVPPVANAFWDMVFDITDLLSIPYNLVSEGYDQFMFWRGPPQ